MQDLMNELRRHRVGYQGADSMRDKAKRAFGSSMHMDMEMPRSRSEKSKIKPRLYARGGHVSHHHSREGDLPNYHDPEVGAKKMKRGGHSLPKTPRLNIETESEMEHMKRGGHSHHHHAHKKHRKHHYEDGGMVGMMGSNPETYSPTIAAKRGGKIHHKKCYNHGGMVGENETYRRGGKAHHSHHSHHKGRHGHKKHHYEDGGMVQGQRPPAENPDYTAAQAAAQYRQPRDERMLNMARQYAPRALQMARQYAPRAQEMLGRYMPRVAKGLNDAYGFAKRNAPAAQEFIGRFSPGMAERFGQFRSAVGLKKGGKAHHGHHGHHKAHHGHMEHHEEHYAMGGVGKIRHGQSTKSGKPIHRRVVKGR